MQKFSLNLLLLLAGLYSHAQNGQLPPVTFTPGQNICDYEPWKLVFHDDFNGIQLNPPWNSFNSWLGMPGGDNDDWKEGRFVLPYNSIQKDENVVVSNGTVKLQMRKEPSSWRCATCTMPTAYTNYSSATIATPFSRPFNTGRFEARIKMPTFPYAHSGFGTEPVSTRLI